MTLEWRNWHLQHFFVTGMETSMHASIVRIRRLCRSAWPTLRLPSPRRSTTWESRAAGRQLVLANMPPSRWKQCADELAPIFTNLFNASPHQHTVSVCFKAATIIPVPKMFRMNALDDWRPVAMTSVVMKVLEWLVLTYLKSVSNFSMDPLQFTYREKQIHWWCRCLVPLFRLAALGVSEYTYTHPVRILQFRGQRSHPTETLTNCICCYLTHWCVIWFLTFFCSDRWLTNWTASCQTVSPWIPALHRDVSLPHFCNPSSRVTVCPNTP